MRTGPSARRVDVFFYGLFMDQATLRQSGVTSVNPRRAKVADFALRIGQRATLVPSVGEQAFGMVMSLTHADLSVLYGAPGLEMYCPEAVLVQTLDGGLFVPALCYNLRDPSDPSERNAEYVKRLQTVLSQLDFPREYVESIL